jgi:hypothetical protein
LWRNSTRTSFLFLQCVFSFVSDFALPLAAILRVFVVVGIRWGNCPVIQFRNILAVFQNYL